MTSGKLLVDAIYGHSVWANDRLLTAAENLTPEQLDSDVPGAYGTVRSIFVHLLSAQRAWLRRFNELDAVAPLELGEFQSIDAIREYWAKVNTETAEYIALLTEDDLQKWIHMKFWSGDEGDARLWQALQHLAFHQQQHRSELAAALTVFGHSPGELDVFDYFESLE